MSVVVKGFFYIFFFVFNLNGIGIIYLVNLCVCFNYIVDKYIRIYFRMILFIIGYIDIGRNFLDFRFEC